MSDVFTISDPVHEKALRMLERDLIAWFTTIDADGAPRAVPVWFWWEDGRAHVMSKPDAVKVAHVQSGSPVLLHLHAGGPHGDDVVILHGTAEVSHESTAQWLSGRRADYLEKYGEAVEGYGMPIDEITQLFETHLVFTPTRVQAW